MKESIEERMALGKKYLRRIGIEHPDWTRQDVLDLCRTMVDMEFCLMMGIKL